MFSYPPQNGLVQAKDDVLCEMCEYVVKEVVKMIDSNKTEVCGFPECCPGSLELEWLSGRTQQK